MGNRLTKIYTRTGDDGLTGMADGRRVAKNTPLIEVIGEIDELNSCLGVLRAVDMPAAMQEWVVQVQHCLFDIGGALSLSGSDYAVQSVTAAEVTALEQQVDAWNSDLTPLKEFILPGGGEASARCHIARAICRRVERHLIGLEGIRQPPLDYVLPYINRLSDALFVACRILAQAAGEIDTLWQSRKLAE